MHSSRLVILGWGIAVPLFGGCASYSSKPLTAPGVRTALATPDDHALRVMTSALKHPMLAPMPVELSRGLTPDEAGVLAVILNPQLRAERDQRGIAAAQLMQAGLLPNPQLVGGLDFPYDSSPPDNFTAYNVGLEWEVTSLITRDAKKRAASKQAESVELDVAWKEWQVAQEAKAAAYDVIALEGQLNAAREAQRQLEENLDVVRRAVDQHQMTVVELAAAEASAQEAHVLVMEQEKELAQKRLALNRSLGLGPDRVVVLRDVEELPARLEPPEAQDLLEGLEQRRLDLVALRRGYESQDQTLRAAILAQFPKISVGLNGARDTSNVRTIGVGVTMDVPVFDRNQAAIATEKATRQKLFDEYAGRLFAAQSEVASAIVDLKATGAQIAAAREALGRLENLVKVYQAALREGNVDVLSFYTVQNNLAQKRIDLVKLKQQLVASWIALELASGRHLPMAAAASMPATTGAPGREP